MVPAGIPLEEDRHLAELDAVDAGWRRKAGPELDFTKSHFRRGTPTWQPVSVAVGLDGRAVGFVSLL